MARLSNGLGKSPLQSCAALLLGLGIPLCLSAPAHAQLVLSEVIVDFQPGKPPRSDIEAWNDSKERMYISAEASEILSPGLPGERRVHDPDPEKLGLLVTPARMILEPGEHKLVRIAAIAAAGTKDRVYRVMIKPVAGGVAAQESALKILVGYDVLVMVRPAAPQPDVKATRTGKTITFHNGGNTNAELTDGRQCDAAGKQCKELASKRLYEGTSWTQALSYDTPVQYSVKTGAQVVINRF